MAKGSSEMEDFTSSLIRDLNKEHGDRIAYNLSVDESPTHVKRWISTGSRLLDYIVANRPNGGMPEGRIVEIFGEPGSGKSHLAAQMCRSAQKMGGMAVYIDTENATSPENLGLLGVDITKRFVYVSEHCTESVMSVAEKTMVKTRAMQKDVPVVIVWDSVAASSPKAELLGEYDDNSVGLQARTISRGMRKITGAIGDNNVLFVILNQTRTKIGVMYGDPTTTSGGKAIPFHSSVRIQLLGGQKLKNSYDEIVGIRVLAKTVKNKVAPPFRNVEFEIHFGYGIKENEQIFDMLKAQGPTEVGEHIVMVGNFHGDGHRKLLVLPKEEFVLDEMFIFDKKKNAYKWPKKADYTKYQMQERAKVFRNFYIKDFGDVLDDPEAGPWCDALLEKVMVRVMQGQPDINPESYIEMSSLADEIGESLGDFVAPE